MSDKIHAAVTAYKGLLVIELLTMEPIENETTPMLEGPFYVGQMIMNTRKHLGVSKEAAELLKMMRPSQLTSGLINWERHPETGDVFMWQGGPYCIVDPFIHEASSAFKVRKFVTIPNNVPEGAMESIDEEKPILH